MRARYVIIPVLVLVMVGLCGCGEQQEPPGPSAGEQEQTERVTGSAGEQQGAEEAESEPDKPDGDGVTCLDIDAPPVTLPDLEGEEVTLREVLQERYVLLVFWATWCHFCEEEIPELNELHEKYSGRLEILAIDYQESREEVASYAEEQGIKYRVLLDEEGKVFRRYGITGTPTLMLVRQNGTICWRGRTPTEAEAKLKELLEAD